MTKAVFTTRTIDDNCRHPYHSGRCLNLLRHIVTRGQWSERAEFTGFVRCPLSEMKSSDGGAGVVGRAELAGRSEHNEYVFVSR